MRRWKDLSNTEKTLVVVAGVSATILVSFLVRELIKSDLRKTLVKVKSSTSVGENTYNVFRFGNKSNDYWHKKIYGNL